MPGGFGFPSSYRSAEICCFTPRIKTHASTTVRFWIYIGRGWVPLGGGADPPPPGSPSPLPARGPPASPPPPRSGGGGPEGVARGFSGKNREGGWRAGGLAAGTPGGVRDATAGVRPPGEGGTVGRQVSTSGARAYTARCPLPGSVECPVLASLPPGVSVRPSVRLSVRRSSGCFWGGPAAVALSAIR